jgi:hypothetical protein
MATAGSFCLFCEKGLDRVLRGRRARERGDEDGRGERAQRESEQPVIGHGYPSR